MRVLVLTAAYPELDGSKNMYYVHTRNLYYIQKGIEVEVLNFSARQEYEIDGIKVFGWNIIRIGIIISLMNFDITCSKYTIPLQIHKRIWL